jgi:hypothetical protein
MLQVRHKGAPVCPSNQPNLWSVGQRAALQLPLNMFWANPQHQHHCHHQHISHACNSSKLLLATNVLLSREQSPLKGPVTAMPHNPTTYSRACMAVTHAAWCRHCLPAATYLGQPTGESTLHLSPATPGKVCTYPQPFMACMCCKTVGTCCMQNAQPVLALHRPPRKTSLTRATGRKLSC